MYSIIIADDHPIILHGTASFLKKLNYKVLGAYESGLSALNNIRALRPDFALIDLSMRDFNGLELLQEIKRENNTTKVIIYTMYRDRTLFNKAVSLKVNGYLLKEFATDELETCLNELKDNKTWFSPQLQSYLDDNITLKVQDQIYNLTVAENKIITLVAQGKSTKEIADLLFLAEKTVENHRGRIIKKLGLSPVKNALLIWASKNLPQNM